jgi:putative phosphoribosyl transferase
MNDLPFPDRIEAGRRLGVRLARRKFKEPPAVLALPRGGVPVGVMVAEQLSAPLDVIVVRKLGVPWQPELAMGAIAGETRILDQALICDLGVSPEEVEAVIARETAERKRRERLFRGGRPPLELTGRSVVLVDDGLATGSSMLAAARHARAMQPAEVIVAVPVAAPDACGRLAQEVDECVSLATPRAFYSVGQFYADFRQVSDREVQTLLERSRRQEQ